MDSRAGDEMGLWFDIEAVDSRHQSSGEIELCFAPAFDKGGYP
jgi:hypothetical protein